MKERQSNQFRAMFLKNATFLKRQKCSLGLQIAIPLVLVILLCIIQIFVKHQFSTMSSTLIPPIDDGDFVALGDVFDFTNPSNIPNIGISYINGSGSGLLGQSPQYQQPNTTDFWPYSEQFSSRTSMMDDILSQKTQLISMRRKGIRIPKEVLRNLPFAALTFNEFDPEQAKLSYEIAIETQPLFKLSNITDPSTYIFASNLLESAFLSYVFNKTIILLAGGVELPYTQNPPALDMGSLLGSIFYPFALSFLLPLYVYSIVLEKQERLREMCLMMGLKIRNYWIVNYLFNLMLYTCALIIVVGISLIFGFAVFTETSGFAMFLLLAGWGNAQIALSFFLSTLFQRTRTATIFTYFLVIISVVVNLILGYQLFENQSPPFFYYWYPPFAFYRGFSIVSALCGLQMCPRTLADFPWSFEPSRCIMWLFVDTVVLLVLSMYLDQVLPKEFGVPKHPLYFLQNLRDKFKSQPTKSIIDNDNDTGKETDSLLSKNNNNSDQKDGDVEEEPLDEDVIEEMNMIKEGRFDPQQTNILIKGLSKRYPNRDKPALDNLYLNIKKGEVLGLLGANGAGKTTAISLLTGLYTPTSGTALVCGLDIRTQMDDIHRLISVTPQQDYLWEDLDCVETLLFYARLKGVEKQFEMHAVEQALREVELWNFKERLVKELSGGMKRRLSIAVSIIGDSKIIFLDEPTAGLDLQQRRLLWTILNNIRKDKSIILTTHSIEEADVLSNRIICLSQGKAKCLGNQQYLKNKFGEGYSLKINIQRDHIGLVNPTELVQQFSPNFKLMESYSGYYVYTLGKNILVSELFKFMLENQQKYHITDFGVSQTSLEDVFLKILANDETIN
ncbi:ABC transporter A family protein [Tieghemostelium lacteum]|uniref:ABC transporter A family protein n=1 Tax=Tieghemostelium lacteum TaxID=361077 RepID=A0A151ZKH8_TIELA|nr:ABC transporter A family protein [Tieghemostelium lacteum]|eukprot:KYQ94390.1 ABC transporter A family protein [Tieghemostelium lacteum]